MDVGGEDATTIIMPQSSSASNFQQTPGSTCTGTGNLARHLADKSSVFIFIFICLLAGRSLYRLMVELRKSLIIVTFSLQICLSGLKYTLRGMGRLLKGDTRPLSRTQLAKAYSFTWETSKFFVKAHIQCVVWSAGGVKSLLHKVFVPAGFWGQPGTLLADDEKSSECEISTLEVDFPDWLRHDVSNHRHVLKTYNTRFEFLKSLPLRQLSRLWGQLHSQDLPEWLRVPAFSLYIKMFGCRLEEAVEQDLTKYANLCQFFQRQLLPGLRPISGTHCLTSPADGTVLYVGEVNDGVLEQVKGVTYSLQGFMGPLEGLDCRKEHPYASMEPEDLAEYTKAFVCNPMNRLYYSVIYLAPGDYHRFHSPAEWTVKTRRHFPGELFSVKPSIARWLQGLFNMNERAVYTGRWQYGFFSMTPVGATNVGSINVYFDKDLQTNHETHDDYKAGEFFDARFDQQEHKGVSIKKGKLVGDFNLGSTIVLVFEAPTKFRFSVKPGQKVKVGQGLGKCLLRRKR
jgi:phosphatidylserine decarboxylase